MLQLDFRKSIIDSGTDVSTDNAIAFAEELERLGYGGLWHSHFIVRDLQGLDTLDVLSAVAARTSRIVLGTAILQAPLYSPMDLARRVVTLDHLSHGRFILGVGTGMLQREFDNMGVPFRQRAGRLDEMLEILRRLWTAEEELNFEGRFYTLRDAVLLPKPIQKPYPKLLIGGVWQGGVLDRWEIGSRKLWSDRAISRIAQYADGWITMSTIPVDRAAEVLKESMERIKLRASELGRTITDEEFELVAQTGHINIQDQRSKALGETETYYGVRVARGFHQARGNPSLETHLATGANGTADEVADFVRRWIAVKKEVPSLKRIVLNPGSLQIVQQLRRFHDQVFPLIEKDLAQTESARQQ